MKGFLGMLCFLIVGETCTLKSKTWFINLDLTGSSYSTNKLMWQIASCGRICPAYLRRKKEGTESNALRPGSAALSAASAQTPPISFEHPHSGVGRQAGFVCLFSAARIEITIYNVMFASKKIQKLLLCHLYLLLFIKVHYKFWIISKFKTTVFFKGLLDAGINQIINGQGIKSGQLPSPIPICPSSAAISMGTVSKADAKYK